MALREHRIVVTEDKDFGQLVYAAAKPSAGVIFIRFPVSARAALHSLILKVVDENGEKLRGSFTVIEPFRVRISRLA